LNQLYVAEWLDGATVFIQLLVMIFLSKDYYVT